VGKYEYIDSRKTEPANLNSVVKMCRWLGVSTSGFYHWLTRPQSATGTRRKALIARIQHYFEESEGTYGYRRIHAELAAEQTGCSPELVRQLLRREGLVACQPRPFRVTTEADALAAANMPDLVKRDFTATRPGGEVIADGYEKGSLIIATNLEVSRWGTVFGTTTWQRPSSTASCTTADSCSSAGSPTESKMP
jgi:putative transposase